MKKLMLLAAGLVASVFILVGCQSAPTLQETFLQGCTAVNGGLAIIAASPLLTADQQDKIEHKVIPANKKICAVGAQLNVTDLKAFHDSLLPIAIGIVAATPMLPNQPLLLAALNAFGPIVQQLIDQIIVAAAPASGASAVSAPAAASMVATQ